MKKLTTEQLEIVNGQSKIGGACVAIAAGSAVYAVGAATQFWNPIGWVSTAFIVADVACAAYGVGSMING